VKRVAIITGILLLMCVTYVAWRNVALHRDREASKSSMIAIRSISLAITQYLERGNALPTLGEGGVSRLYAEIGGALPETLPEEDGWGTEIQCLTTPHSYVLLSLGSDRTADPIRLAGEFESRAHDIVVANGEFWAWHHGPARGPGDRDSEIPFEELLPQSYGVSSSSQRSN
jgi:hypothetical protein